MSKAFPLFEKAGSKYVVSRDAQDRLAVANNPQIICLYGIYRVGKSTKCNQIVNGPEEMKPKEPFQRGASCKPVTTGCNMYGPISMRTLSQLHGVNTAGLKLDPATDFFVVDTEGLSALQGVSDYIIPCILSLLQISTLDVLYLTALPTSDNLEDIKANMRIAKLLKVSGTKLTWLVPALCVLITDVTYSDNDTDALEELERQRVRFDTNCVEEISKQLRESDVDNGFNAFTLPSFEKAVVDSATRKVYWNGIRDLVQFALLRASLREARNGKALIDMLTYFIDCFQDVHDIKSVDNITIALQSMAANKLDKLEGEVFKDLVDELNKEVQNNTTKLIAYKDNKSDREKFFNAVITNKYQDTWSFLKSIIPTKADGTGTVCVMKLQKHAESLYSKAVADLKQKFEAKCRETGMAALKGLTTEDNVIRFSNELPSKIIAPAVESLDKVLYQYAMQHEGFDKVKNSITQELKGKCDIKVTEIRAEVARKEAAELKRKHEEEMRRANADRERIERERQAAEQRAREAQRQLEEMQRAEAQRRAEEQRRAVEAQRRAEEARRAAEEAARQQQQQGFAPGMRVRITAAYAAASDGSGGLHTAAVGWIRTVERVIPGRPYPIFAQVGWCRPEGLQHV